MVSHNSLVRGVMRNAERRYTSLEAKHDAVDARTDHEIETAQVLHPS